MLAKLSATATRSEIAASASTTAARALMAFIYPSLTSPRRGEVDARSASGEGSSDFQLKLIVPHPDPLPARGERGRRSQCAWLLRFLRGGEQLVPQRLELGLRLDDVVADRPHLRHQLGVVGVRQADDLAALGGPGLALVLEEGERPRNGLALRLVGGLSHLGLQVGRQAVEPALAEHSLAE